LVNDDLAVAPMLGCHRFLPVLQALLGGLTRLPWMNLVGRLL
jgi:hypothetical protein